MGDIIVNLVTTLFICKISVELLDDLSYDMEKYKNKNTKNWIRNIVILNNKLNLGGFNHGIKFRINNYNGIS